LEQVAIEEINQIPLDGSIPFINFPQVLCIGCNDLTDSEKITLQAMMCFDYGRYVKGEDGRPKFVRNGYCDISLDTLGKLRGLSKRAVQRHVENLEKYGLIKKENRYSDGIQISDRKRFIFNSLFERQLEVDSVLEELGIQKRLSGDINDMGERHKCHGGETPTSRRRDANVTQINNNINNNNTNINVSVTTPIIEDPTKSTRNNSPQELSEEFLVGDVKSRPESSSKKIGIYKKIQKEAWGQIGPKDLIEYFKDSYLKTYKLYYTLPVNTLPKTLSILKTGFLAKYGAKRCIEIIDLIFKLYDSAGLANTDYPRPTITSLSQDWLINKLLDHIEVENEIQDKQERLQKESEYTDIPGKYTPIDIGLLTITEQDLLRSSRLPYYFSSLARRGYLPPDWVAILRRDKKEAMSILEEAAIEWNQVNPVKLRL
jgi:hypothetical protein